MAACAKITTGSIRNARPASPASGAYSRIKTEISIPLNFQFSILNSLNLVRALGIAPATSRGHLPVRVLGVLAELGRQLERGAGEVARGTGTEAYAGDIALRGEILRRDGPLRADAHAEDAEVVYLHVLAVHQQLLDTIHHVLQHAVDGAGGEGGVVGGHVLGQGGDVYRLLAYGTGVPLVEGCHVLLVLVLILLVADHNVLFFNVDTKIRQGMGALSLWVT